MITDSELDPRVIKLPRGGYIIDSEIGYIQFGSPPETIKDTMKFPKGVPKIIVLPCEFFSWIKGISVAEVEFPIYYNFFLNNEKTLIICHKHQIARFNTFLSEAVFGPTDLFFHEETNDLEKSALVPNIEKEMEYFRRGLNLSDLVEFGIFENNIYTLDGIIIEQDENSNFRVIFENDETILIPGKIDYVPTYDIGKRLYESYKPPLFGITCLGSSHGFDPLENTSGFIIWLNHKGIMVDPPVNSTEWLKDSNVSPKYIDSIILTHCHADHDAGTFQKILEEGIVKVHSTKTIILSFLNKYSALTNVSPDYLLRLFKFRPVKIENPVYIHGGKFIFFYSLHSIPTIGFILEFQGKSFVYSSDHNNDPALHKKLLDAGVIDEKRFSNLSNFNWNADIIYHESGFAPLHTPTEVLASLPEQIQKKIHVYHISKKDFPDNVALERAKFGIEETIDIDVPSPLFEKAYQILGLINYLDFFEDLPTSKSMEFINIIKEEKFKKDEIIIKKDTIGDKFYIIFSGNVAVIGDDFDIRKIYGPCDYFGEAALVTGKKRSADVVAETDVIAYTIEKDKFLYFISDTDFEKTLIRLAKIRDSESWNVISNSKIFGVLTATQKTILESMIHKVEKDGPGILIEESSQINEVYIIRDGKVKVTKKGKTIAELKTGDSIGSMVKVHRGELTDYTFSYDEFVSLYVIRRDDILKFLERNPGLIMKLTYDF